MSILLQGSARFTKPINFALQRVYRDGMMDKNFVGLSYTPRQSLFMKSFLLLVVGLLFLLHSGVARATSPSMAVSQGMGDAVRSNPYDSGAVFAAPGMVWLDGRFDVSGGAQFGSDGAMIVQVAAHDSQTSPIGLGVQWFRTSQDLTPAQSELPGWRRKGTSFTNEVQSSVLAATLGGGGVHHLFGAGLSLRYFNSTSTLLGAQHSFNLAPGVSAVMADQIYVSLTAENVIPLDFEGSPMGMGTGTRWQPTDRFGLAFDTLTTFGASNDDTVSFSPMVGAEFRAADVVPIRVGWKRDGVTSQRLVTGGIGASNESFGLNYSVQLDLDQEENVGHWHGVSLRISM